MKFKGLNFLSKGTDYLSMDFGSQNIRLVTGKSDNNRISVYNAITISMPQNSFEDGKITNILEIKKVLKRAFDDNKINIKPVICSIESTSILTREIVLPVVSPQETKEMIGYEIGEYLPIELDKYVIQFKVIECFTEENVRKQKVLVAAMPAEVSFSYFELIDSLGLKPIRLDIHSNIVSKLFNKSTVINNNDPINEKTIAVLDLGHSHINVNIIERGDYKFNRIISTGGAEIDWVISSFLNIDLADAQQKKHQMKGFSMRFEEVAAGVHDISKYDTTKTINNASNVNSIIKDSIRDIVASWAEEINKVFKYYTSRSPKNTIDTIYLYGGSAQLEQIPSYMVSLLSIPTYIINELSGIEILNHTVKEQFPNYLNAAGALIKESNRGE